MADPKALVAVAERYSPRYACHGDRAIVVDVSGLTRLIGPPAVLADEIARSARGHDLAIQLAIASTHTAALVLAHARPGVTIVPRGEEAAFLSHVTLASACGHAEPILETFTRWGLRTLGDLAALPPDQLAARLGADGARWQALARGVDLEPFVPDRPEERFDASQSLEWPIDGLEPLSFVLTRLLEPLSVRLAARDRGVAVLHVRLHLVTREMHARRLELPAPLRDVKTLRTLAMLDLEAHPPDAAIDRVDVFIEPTRGRVLQHTLFSRAQPAPEQIATLVARLGALMGQDRVGSPVVVDTYRPGAYAMGAFAGDEPRRPVLNTRERRGRPCASDMPVGADAITRSLRRCRLPVPARVVMDAGRPVRVTTDRREFPGGRVLSWTGPWRSSGDWWQVSATPRSRAQPREAEGRDRSVRGERGWAAFAKAPASVAEAVRRPGPASSKEGAHPKSWSHDEWDVALADGAAYRIFHDRETGGWFIEAIAD